MIQEQTMWEGAVADPAWRIGGGAVAGRAVRAWVGAALVCAMLVVASYFLVDRPVATYVHAHFGANLVVNGMVAIAEACGAVALLAMVVFGVWGALGARLWPWARTAMLAGVSFVAATVVKDELKYAFGRTWPETWVNHNPSFIGNGTFGFFPFHGGPGWGSFPSGHTTVVMSVCVVLWLRVPVLRPLWALMAVLVMAGLLLADYHFVSDIIAGGFLGTAVAVATVRLAERTIRV